MKNNPDVQFVIGWVKEKWNKYNRQVLTFIQVGVLTGLIAICDAMLTMTTGDGLPGDFKATVLVLGSTGLSAVIQYVRAELTKAKDKEKSNE